MSVSRERGHGTFIPGGINQLIESPGNSLMELGFGLSLDFLRREKAYLSLHFLQEENSTSDWLEFKV